LARRMSSRWIVCNANACSPSGFARIDASQTKYVRFVPTATIAATTCTSFSGRYQSTGET
jgi:hypothetical protein